LNDPWQPALLRMIEMVATAASASGTPVGVCGEAAADPLLALVLTGLGISSLSMAPAALGEVGPQPRQNKPRGVPARRAGGVQDRLT
jgi:phosphotransferase system enzyme I (PtsI)